MPIFVLLDRRTAALLISRSRERNQRGFRATKSIETYFEHLNGFLLEDLAFGFFNISMGNPLDV